MRALMYDSYGDADVLYFKTIRKSKPGPGEVAVHIHAAGVNPVDWKIREGMLSSVFAMEFPAIPGFDMAGTVDAVGEDVSHLAPGDKVFGYIRHDVVHQGSYADYGCFKADQLAKIPDGLTMEEAASLPIPALTVWQALLSSAGIAPGQVVLIHGGAGGVGSIAVQAACHFGAKVISTASQENLGYVIGLGATQAFDYKSPQYWDDLVRAAPQGYDVVWDSVGGTTLENSYPLVKPGGAIVSLNEPPLDAICQGRSIRGYLAHALPNAAQLEAIAALIVDGQMTLPPLQIIAFEDAVDAMRQSQTGHMRGKIILKME